MTTATDTTYNGWTNYETWNVKLWLDNDEATQELQHEWSRQAKLQLYDDKTCVVACLARSFVEEMAPTLTGTYEDLLATAIQNVNFMEIARHILEDSE
ncbi:hypothetical protein LCGC14_0853260 [marine sediment metagenome]|uniref:Uncharacterized protein n=1 Tax=marine sediment metagenome TaxID=412755 RepID=A0A0F9PEI2_9ZZZZ